MVLPLIKKGDWVRFWMGDKWYTLKCFNSNPSTVWVETEKGNILKIHKLRNKVSVVEEPKEEVGKEETTKKLLNNLKKKSLKTPS